MLPVDREDVVDRRARIVAGIWTRADDGRHVVLVDHRHKRRESTLVDIRAVIYIMGRFSVWSWSAPWIVAVGSILRERERCVPEPGK